MTEEISCTHELYLYISKQAAYDPVMTLFVCPPNSGACSCEAAETFAETSGWKAVAEEHAAVLVIPVVREGWSAQPLDLIPSIYAQIKNAIPTRSGKSLYQRGGFLWCWETLIYLVGYEEGAVFAGNTLVAYPNRFAAVALVNGAPDDYSAGRNCTDHWLVPKVSSNYSLKNHQIPVAVWLLHEKKTAITQAAEYFSQCSVTDSEEKKVQFGDLFAEVRWNAAAPAQQVRLSVGRFSPTPELSQLLIDQLFHQVIRWKDGPDGKLTVFSSRDGFYAAERFERRATVWNNQRYEYLVYAPAGLSPAQRRGLPLVFSVHGRGEPAWMFAEKNGWDRLADETREFLLVVPDSPENIWFLQRDEGVFQQIIDEMAETDGIDRERVYLTGFSNGGMITREVGTRFPRLFAGLSPWNAPPAVTDPSFPDSQCQQPCFIIVGDNDALAPVDATFVSDLLQANGCIAERDETAPLGYVCQEIRSADYYTTEKGYTSGSRFTTYIFHGLQGDPRVAVTIMQDMPHGAIHDESRATWEFLRQFRRCDHALTVQRIPEQH